MRLFSLCLECLQSPKGITGCCWLLVIEAVIDMVLVIGVMVISDAAGTQSLPGDTTGYQISVETKLLFGGMAGVAACTRGYHALCDEPGNSKYRLSVIACFWVSGVAAILLILHGPRFDSLDAWTTCLGWISTSNAVLSLLCMASFHKMFPVSGVPASASVWPEVVLNPAELTFRTYTIELDIEDDVETGKLEDCLVCLEGYGKGDIVRELYCKHSFHSACIESWVSSSGKGCPLRCAPHPKASVEES